MVLEVGLECDNSRKWNLHFADLVIKQSLKTPPGALAWPFGQVHMNMQSNLRKSQLPLSERALDPISSNKLVKMKPEDDPEDFLRMFECVAEGARWPKNKWPVCLAPLLSGEAQAICQAFPDSTADYDQLKYAILEQLGVSEESYRKKFRSVTFLPEVGPYMVSCQLREWGRRWLKPEIRSSAEIVELVIVEQFIQILPAVAGEWLSHHRIGSLDVAVELIEGFLAREDCKPAVGDGISDVQTLAPEKEHLTEDYPVVTSVFSLSVKPEEEAGLQEETEPERRTSAGDPVVESVFSQSIKCEGATQLKEVLDAKGRTIDLPFMTPDLHVVIKKEEAEEEERSDSITIAPALPFIAPVVPFVIKEEKETNDMDHQGLGRRESIVTPTALPFITPVVPVVIKEEKETSDLDHQGLGRRESIVTPTDQKKNLEQENTAMDQKQCIESQENKNTRIKTEFDLKMLKTYLISIGEKTELKEMPHHVLDAHVANFVVNLKKKDGTEYEPSTVRGIVGSIDRHLLKHHYPHSIFSGLYTDFTETKKTLSAKQNYLKKLGKGKRPQKAQPLSDEDINKLYDTGTMGLQSPTALLNLLFFSIGIQFALRTREHYDLKWGDVILSTDTEGTQFLEYTERQTTTTTGQNPRGVHPVKRRIYQNVITPDRDPVRAYKQYATSRPKEMKTPESPFYLAPNSNYVQGWSLWFQKKKIGINKMRNMMSTMKTESGLPPNKRITNHSTRKPIIQKLAQSDVPPTEIQQASSHKNVQSINNYSILTERKQENISEILSGSTIGASTSNTITVVTSQAQQPIESTSHGKNNSLSGQNVPFNKSNITINSSSSLPTKTKRRRIIQDSGSD